MNERENYDAQQEAKRETAGRVDQSTRARMWEGLTKYLAAEARHARKSAASDKAASDKAASEKAASEKAASEKRDQDRRSP